MSLDKHTHMKDYFDSAMTYGNLRQALRRCCRNVRWKDSVVGYELHAPQNTHKLLESIQNGTYKISTYQHFTIYEPKKRDITATRIQDRQVQMALCMGGLYDDLTEHFIYDNCACQVGKGTDFALKRLKHHLVEYYRESGREGWVLKCDVHHFFPSTRHDVAKAAVSKRVSDQKAREFVFDVIDSFGGDTGIGLGSQISQLIELAVLDDIDHYIKEKLHMKHYIRYMDDFILIHHDKEYLQYCKAVIEKMLNDIGLELNKKTTLYPLSQGAKFLQWRFVVTSTGKVVMKMSGKKTGRERRRLCKLLNKEASGELEEGTAMNSLIAWGANASRGDAYFKYKRMKYFYYTVKAGIKNGNHPRKTLKSRTRRMVCGYGSRQERRKYRLSGNDVRHRNSY